MIWRRALLIVGAWLALGVSAQAAAPGVINSYVGVCDPNFATHCIAPNSSGAIPVTGSFSSSIAAFAPTGQASLSVSSSSSNVALGSVGPTALVNNTGATAAYIKFGDASVTAATTDYLVPGGWAIAFDVGSNTYIAAITATSTTTLSITTGTGLPALTGGGGGGGGGGGAVTVADGADVAEGATSDAAATAGSTGTVSSKLRLVTTQLGTINSTLGSPMQNSGGTVTATQATGSNLHTQVDASALPTGAATAALQTTGNTALGTINTTLGTPFQAGGSIGNTTFAVTNSGTFPVQATLSAETTKVIGTVNQGTSPWVSSISGTVPLPTGAATSALQTTGNTALTTINTTLGTPMQNSGGTVVVTQATGSNLHVQVDGGGLGVSLNSSPSLANGNGVVSTQGGSVLSATNGAYTNILQGNAVLSSGNPIFASVTASALPTGASTAANQTSVIGTKTAGTAATNSLLAGGVYYSAGVSLSDGQQAGLQLATDGSLDVNCVSGCSGGSGGGGTSSNFAATFPLPGTAAGFLDSTGLLMAPGQVDALNNLDVNCVVGCSGGTFNNNSDGVATSSTNGQSAAWLYGFNGTTFDRLQVDASKYLKVNVEASALPTGAATSALQTTINTTLGTPFQAGGSIGNTAFIANAGTNLNTSALALDTSVGTTNTDIGPPGATACATDTGSCSLNALAQRQAQRLTTINTTLGTPIQTTGGTVGLVAGSAVIGHVINDASSAVIGHVITDSGSTTAVTGNVAITAASGAIASGAVASGAYASGSISDGAVVTLGAKADAKNAATDTTAVSGISILKEISSLEQAPVSRAVTNAGTFPVQATLSAETTKVIGEVNQGTSPWVVGQSTAANLNGTATQGPAAAVTAGWPMIGGELGDTTGTFTNATQTTSVTTGTIDGYSTVTASITGTYGTATAVFEISDDGGTTWFSANASRSDGSAVETGYTSLTNTTRMWTLSANGADQFRVRSTAVASGTVSVRISVESTPTSEAAAIVVPSGVGVTQTTSPWVDNVSQFGGTNISTGTGTGGAGIPRVTISSDSSLAANQSVNVAQVNGVATTTGNGASGTGVQRVTIASDSTGQVTLAAGSNLVGKVGIDQTTPGTTNAVQVIAGTTGGTTLSTLTLAASTNATNVKNAAGSLYAISGFNGSSATPIWISLYNNSGTPTCGTGIIQQYLIPGSTTGAGFVFSFPVPKAFSTGIAFCATTGIAGTGSAAATTYVVNFDYK